MPKHTIKFSFADIILNATVRDTPTGDAVLQALPIHANVQTWGDEVYFPVPVESSLEQDAKSVVEAGEIAFWVEGNCIAIGFGPTPISHANEIRLAAETNIWADTEDDVRQLTSVKSGESVLIELS